MKFKPNLPFRIKAKCYKVNQRNINGRLKDEITDSYTSFFCSFKTYGGTEVVENGVMKVLPTGTIHTFYNKNIGQTSVIEIGGFKYKIISPIENIDMRNMYYVFKVVKI